MKTYNIKQLKTLANQQGYKLAALENSKGERLQPFNNIKVVINKQLDTITNRLMSELFDDGVYYVLMASTINKTKSADRYPIIKGNINPNEIKEDKTNPITIVHSPEQVLTYQAALDYQQTISDLKNEIALLKLERTNLLEQLQEALDENELSENTAPTENIMQTFLKEAMPSVTPILDRYFDLEEKKLNLLELKATRKPLQRQTNNTIRQPQKKIHIVTGSQQHLELIEMYYKKQMDDKLGAELDKLEDFNFELYKKVCDKLGIDISDDDDDDNNGNGGNGGDNE